MSEPETDPLPDLLDLIKARTPARLLVGRAGSSYKTETQLALREDHAAAMDAVRAEMDLEKDLGREFLLRWNFFGVQSRANSKAEYLLRPDLGRLLGNGSADMIRVNCRPGTAFNTIGTVDPDLALQIVVGDGLSSAAVAAQVPKLFPSLMQGAADRGWKTGRPFAIRYCRVGIINEVGELLKPTLVILLIGERPGLATSESLSAYLAYRPKSGDTDANRNLISNIHDRGTPPEEASQRILNLAGQMIRRQLSGVAIKESLEEPDGLPRVGSGE